MISEKKDLLVGSSGSSNILAWESQRAGCLMSHRRIVPLLEEYTKRLHSLGWNSEAVITSVSSSMLAGLISTMLKDWSVISMCHRLIRRSSADRYVSWSEFTDIELMW